MSAARDPHPRDPDMARLSDVELAGYIRHWSQVRARYRQQAEDQRRRGRRPRRRGDSDSPGATRPGFSAWWAGKILDRGLRERERRRSQTTDDSGSRHD